GKSAYVAVPDHRQRGAATSARTATGRIPRPGRRRRSPLGGLDHRQPGSRSYRRATRPRRGSPQSLTAGPPHGSHLARHRGPLRPRGRASPRDRRARPQITPPPRPHHVAAIARRVSPGLNAFPDCWTAYGATDAELKAYGSVWPLDARGGWLLLAAQTG